MKKIFLIFTCIITSLNYAQKIICVPRNYSTIQLAIDNAEDYDTILVSNGIYTENLNISKSLSFIGSIPYETIICPDTVAKYSVYINADNITFKYFYITKKPLKQEYLLIIQKIA